MQPSSLPLVLGVSADALFSAAVEAGTGARDQRTPVAAREVEALAPGPALPLLEAFLAARKGAGRGVEVVVLSRQRPEQGLGVLEALRQRELAVERTVFTAGTSASRYLRAFEVELFLTLDEGQAQEASQAGTAAVLALPHGAGARLEQIRIAVAIDAAAAGAGDHPREQDDARLAQLAGLVGRLRGAAEASGTSLRTALVGSGGAVEQEQALRGLGRCGLQLDEAFSLAGLPREAVLRAFDAQLLLEARHLPVAPEPKPEALARSGREAPAESDSSGLDSPFSRLRFRG